MTIINGNALQLPLADGSVDAIVTDPPYAVNLNASIDWDVWSNDWWPECFRVLKADGLMAFTIAPHVAHERIPSVCAAGFSVLEVGFWVYGRGRPVTVSRLKRNYDMVYFMSKGTKAMHVDEARLNYKTGDLWGVGGNPTRTRQKAIGRQFSGSQKSSTYTFGGDAHPSNVACEQGCDAFGDSGYGQIFAVKRLSKTSNHETQKPIDLMAQIVKLVSKPGDVVLDPFSGSGTTALAARELGRMGIGIELNTRYLQRSQDRNAQMTVWESR
jgi:site-specific DNA-methyltransferase (adenine-specific)